jgi:putative ABC transport system permease protein
MIFQNIKLAFRGLLKNKAVTSINLIGLTIGITACLLIFAYVNKEKSTDKFLPGYSNIYVLMNEKDPSAAMKMIDLVRDEIPEVKNITTCDYDWSPQVFFKNKDINIKIEKLLESDSSFFKVFAFEAVWGNLLTALNAPNKIVLTQKIARKLFGNENPVGKAIIYNSTYLPNELVEVGAVIKDLPHNSSWQFEAVISIQTNAKIDWYAKNMESWGAQNYFAFFTVDKSTDPTALNKKLVNISKASVPEDYKKYVDMSMFPYKDVYFKLPALGDVKHGNILTLSIIQITGLLILLLVCINYVNMVTAQRQKRMKNIGIIKTFGSNRLTIVKLLITESALMLTFALVGVVFLSCLFVGGLNNLTDSDFTFEGLYLVVATSILPVIFVFTLLFTGVVPGIIFCRYNSIQLVKNNNQNSENDITRNGLLIFQFAISILLITGVLFINRQNNFLSNRTPGFDKNNIIYVNTNSDLQKKIQPFKNEIGSLAGISNYTFSSEPLGDIHANWSLTLDNKGIKQDMGFANLNVNPNFFDFFGIKLKQGTAFSNLSHQNKDFIFNEKALSEYKVKELSEAKIIIGDGSKIGNIIGEVENFNFESMHVPIRSAGFMCSDEADEVMYIKLNFHSRMEFKETLNSLKEIWNKYSPNFPFEFRFLDSSWDALYKQDQQFQKILSIATIISLLLSSIGLIGLTFFIIEQRTKEIGIRKVNGARVTEVMAMLNRDFIKWVAIAFVIACPIAWYAMHKWLENFAYKTELSWWVFAAAGVIAMVIALITVSWQSGRAATRNPVESLRYE